MATSELHTLHRPARRVVMCCAAMAAALCLDAGAAVDEVVGAALAPAVPAAPQVTAERSLVNPGLQAPLDAQGRPLNELAGVSYRWWSRHGRSHFGVGLGTVGFVGPLGEERALAPGVLYGSVPTLTVGWRYHFSSDTALYADATGARSLASNAMPGLYNTKVGMEWQPAKSRVGFENRSLGIQLQSGYRMSLRVKSNGLGLYFRGKF